MRKKSQFRYFSALSFDFCVIAGFSNSFSGKEKKNWYAQDALQTS